ERMLTKQQARRFILAHQGLLTGVRFEDKQGILAFVKRVGCLQFDPLNVVGFNQELVLQSRIPEFRSEMLQELLYKDRLLVDGWDKNLSIYRIEDWPYFNRNREAARLRLHGMPHIHSIVPQVVERLTVQGPLSSGDLDYNEVVDWSWAPTRLSRAVLESLYFAGDLIIHRKEHTRKIYDLSSRHLPADYLVAPDPNPVDELYWEWHVLRRIAAIGLLWNKASDAWLGILGFKTKERNEAFQRLQEKGKVMALQVEGISQPLYIRTEDMPLLNEVTHEGYDYPARAFILAPLDNMIWDRRLIKELFGFEYRWEVYKPAAERQYGYYVLPVMCEDRFVGRFEPVMDKKSKELVIKNWWWEPDIIKNERLFDLLKTCFEQFIRFSGAKTVHLEGAFARGELPELEWLGNLKLGV
ncbi:MAG: Winged helix DNA-binding domain protein, partial [Cohnella sp.]|nr:Winged helix DNA-binding domain protein [Cohnella sp.]